MWEAVWLFRESILGSLLVAAGCSVVGVYVVLRRVVFVGAALAQLASAGIALSLFLASAGVTFGLLTGQLVLAAAATLGGVAVLGLRRPGRRIPSDALLGAVFVAAGAVSVLLVAGTPAAEIHELFFGGDVLFVSRAQIARLATVVGLSLLTHAAFARVFLFVSFDAETAASLGYRVRAWNLALFLSLGAVVVVSMQAVGVLVTFAYLVLPGICGVLLGRRPGALFLVAVGSALAGTLLGFGVSIWRDLPTGSTIIAVLAALTVVCWAASRVRSGRG